MLERIVPNLIDKHYDLIWHSIQDALPPTSLFFNGEVTNNIMSCILDGTVQCWAIVAEGDKLVGISTTTISKDFSSGISSLVLYTFEIFHPKYVKRDTILQVIKDYMQIAADYGCQRLVTYSASSGITKIFKSLGGDVSYRYITLDVIKKEEEKQDEDLSLGRDKYVDWRDNS